MFESTSFHTIDPKGRIIIPARFRDYIKASGDYGIVVSNRNKCLFAYTVPEWKVLKRKILGAKNVTTEHLKRFFVGNACTLKCDRQDRILLPPNLREYAGLDKEIVMVGIEERFEIWDKERWTEVNQKSEEFLETPEALAECATLGI